MNDLESWEALRIEIRAASSDGGPVSSRDLPFQEICLMRRSTNKVVVRAGTGALRSTSAGFEHRAQSPRRRYRSKRDGEGLSCAAVEFGCSARERGPLTTQFTHKSNAILTRFLIQPVTITLQPPIRNSADSQRCQKRSCSHSDRIEQVSWGRSKPCAVRVPLNAHLHGLVS